MTVLAVEGYEPEGLEPIDEQLRALVPFNVGERVAFPDVVDNPAAVVEGSVEERHGDHPHAGMYGIIKAIGYADGGIRLDLLVFDPAEGVTEDSAVIYRAGLGELQ